MYQGRDEKGRFGNGTSPKADDGDSASRGGGAGMLPQMQAVVYGAVGHLSPAERAKFTAHLDRAGVARLGGCLRAWSKAKGLGRDSFRERFLGGTGSDEVVDHLRKAADIAAGATTPEQQRDASGELAAAWRLVGADRWPRFITAAHELTMSVAGAATARVLLAQATMPNKATDASSVGTVTANAPSAYVADTPRQWIGQRSVGSGECVDLVRQATGAPRSVEWRPGAVVQGNTDIRPGTAIATFNSNDHYSGHAAIHLGQDESGIQVVDQWNLRQNGRVVRQHPPSARTLPFDQPQRALINRGESYRVVE
jgi:hypothetical protein